MSADLLRQEDALRGGASFLCDEPTTESAAGPAALALYPDGGCGGGLGDGDFVGLSVGDFDLGEEMQLDGFPIDLWAGAIESNLVEESLGLEAKLGGTDFSCLEEDFHQMLDEWDSQLGSLQASDMETLPLAAPTILTTTSPSPQSDQSTEIKTELSEEDFSPDIFIAATPASAPTLLTSSPTTICVRRPVTTSVSTPSSCSSGRGLMSVVTAGRQLPVSNASAMRSPVISRGICYTRTGGLGVTRSMQSSGLIPGSPRASSTLSASTASNTNFHTANSGGGGGVLKVKPEDPTFVFTPVSPRSAPSGSNAPDFFVASTRSTADVKSSYSSYCRVLDSCLDTKPVGSPAAVHPKGEYNLHHQGVKGDFSPGTPSSSGPGSSASHSQVKIIASLSPKRDGSSATRIISSRSIRDSLPKELIDKIKAASQGRKTIAIIEPITRNNPNRLELGSSSGNGCSNSVSVMDSLLGGGSSGRFSCLGSKLNMAAANMSRWRSVGVVPPLSNSNNNISDHDYCCPSRPGGRYRSRFVSSSQSKMLRQLEDRLSRSHSQVGSRMGSPVEEARKGASRVGSPVEEGSEARKDSGLESCEMSDCSEDGGLYDRLPGYLTNVSVQTSDSMGVMEEHGYNRLPAYLVKPQQSLLKSSVARSLERNTMVVAPLEHSPQMSSTNNSSSSYVLDVETGKAVVAAEDTRSDNYISLNGQLDHQLTGDFGANSGDQVGNLAGASTSQTSVSLAAAIGVHPATSNDSGTTLSGGGVKRRRESSDNVDSSSSSDEAVGPSAVSANYRKRRFHLHREYKGRKGGSPPMLVDRRVRCRRRSGSCSSSPDRRTYRRRLAQQSAGLSSHVRSKKRRTSFHHHDDDGGNDDVGDDDLDRMQGGRGDALQLAAAARQRRPLPPRVELQETQRQVEERRVIYVGGIAEGTLKADLRQRFQRFGPILDISLHFRERGSNYGFVTFQYKADAYAAVEQGNDDPSLERFDLSFGGRRSFCKEKYYDLDDVDEGSGDEGGNQSFDELLRRARGRK